MKTRCGILFACLVLAGSMVWAKGPAPGPVPAVRRESDGDRQAQRRRRPRRPAKAEAPDNPYGTDDRRRRGAGAEEPTPSKLRSEDPRTAPDADRPAEGNGRRAAADPGGSAGDSSMQRSDRLDFDERLIQGQTARSGAVYLFSRPPRDLPELVKLRKTFRAEISRTIVGREPAPAQREKAAH